MDDEELRRHQEHEAELRRWQEHDAELRWKRYNSPSRRRLSEEYHRSRGDDEVVEGVASLRTHEQEQDEG